jgi:hypothetical protein
VNILSFLEALPAMIVSLDEAWSVCPCAPMRGEPPHPNSSAPRCCSGSFVGSGIQVTHDGSTIAQFTPHAVAIELALAAIIVLLGPGSDTSRPGPRSQRSTDPSQA